MTVYDASRMSAEAYQAARASAGDVVTGMTRSAGELYAQTCARAQALHATMGEKAVGEAVRQLSEQGIQAYTYTRSDGTLVRVPCDVGIRRAVGEAGKQARNAQVLDIAAENEMDLIEVSATSNCRDSHQAIDGQIFSLSGKSDRYPEFTSDLQGLLDDYNCQHQIAIYIEGNGSRFSDWRQDAIYEDLPDDWTLDDAASEGRYTREQVSALRTRQRALENDIRKAKRSEDVLKGAKLDASRATAKKNAARAQLRELTSKHSAVLRRESHREQVYDSARRMFNSREQLPSGWMNRRGDFRSNMEAVESKGYRGRVRSMFGDGLGDEVHSTIAKMLERKSETPFEEMYAFDLTAKELIASETTQKKYMRVEPSERYLQRVKARVDAGHEVAGLHNHPLSGPPSYSDLGGMVARGERFGVIACHDGSLIRFQRVHEPMPGYELAATREAQDKFDAMMGRVYSKIDEQRAFKFIEDNYGIRIERFG